MIQVYLTIMKILGYIFRLFAYFTGLSLTIVGLQDLNYDQNIIILLYSAIFFKLLQWDNKRILISMIPIYIYLNIFNLVFNIIGTISFNYMVLTDSSLAFAVFLFTIAYISGYRHIEKKLLLWDNKRIFFSVIVVYVVVNILPDISSYIVNFDTGRILGLCLFVVAIIFGYSYLEKLNIDTLRNQLQSANKNQKIFATIGIPIFTYWLIYGTYWTLYSYNPILYFVTDNPFPLIVWLGCFVGYNIFIEK